MTVTFFHPPTGTTNPLIDFEPWNEDHYPAKNETGVYIYGIRANVDGYQKFIPITVGQGNLRQRLYKDHYLGKFANSITAISGGKSDPKELWDFSSISSLTKVFNIYSEMYFYDSINNYRKGTNRISEQYLKVLLGLKFLLFYNNRNYFIMKAGGAFNNFNQKERELNYKDAILEGFDPNGEIQKALNGIYAKEFYYVFCYMKDILPQLEEREDENVFAGYAEPSAQLERIERAVKRALNIIGIHTTAKAEGEFVDMGIDLTNIQQELVNLGGHPYNDQGKYSKLIIQIKK